MQYKLYQGNEASDRLILYFNGWAMTPEAVEHLALPRGWDLLIVWDYRSPDLAIDLTPYREIHLVAWSMGVWAADRFYTTRGKTLPIVQAIAVCGTGYPMDDRWGIPRVIFEGTLNGLNEANRTRFNRRMCGGKTYRHLFDALQRRSTEEIREELELVYDHEQHEGHTCPKAESAPWTLALVGREDKIVPSHNQEAYWAGQGVPMRIGETSAHYMLGEYSAWEDLWT